jgi:amidohydrolase
MYATAGPYLLDVARAMHDRVVADRRAIHRHPEIAFQEHRTAALVASRLTDLGIEVRTGVGGTGVVGTLRGARPGRTVLLRADMDALPMPEAAMSLNEGFRSEVDGAMHACGHDAHVAILLGAAEILASHRDEIAGIVTLMFQPAEEIVKGAPAMMADGLLDPLPDGAFALHVGHNLPTGSLFSTPGPSAAASDRFEITLTGRGVHAAWPHLGIDPVVAGAHLTTALHALVSREVGPGDPAVITVGSLIAGTVSNVIPDTAALLGTVRTFRPATRDHLERRIADVAHGIAMAFRCTADVNYDRGTPPVINDAGAVDLARRAITKVVGDAAWASPMNDGPTMGAEDWAFILERVRGCVFLLGVRDPAWEAPRPVHSPRFALDENALPYGVAAMAGVALQFLSEG